MPVRPKLQLPVSILWRIFWNADMNLTWVIALDVHGILCACPCRINAAVVVVEKLLYSHRTELGFDMYGMWSSIFCLSIMLSGLWFSFVYKKNCNAVNRVVPRPFSLPNTLVSRLTWGPIKVNYLFRIFPITGIWLVWSTEHSYSRFILASWRH